MIGLSNGEAIRKDIVEPNGTPAFRKPTVIGMVEQAQKGVNAPNPAAMTLPIIPEPDSFFRIVSSGIYISIISTAALINRNKAINSIVINTKYCNVSNKVFIIY